MFMRLLSLRVKTERLNAFIAFYNTTIIPALHKTKGCAFAFLMKSADQSGECVSLTIWDSQKSAETYESGGAFKQLLEQAGEYLEDSSEWKVELSKDLELEYKPAAQEPDIRSYVVNTYAAKPNAQKRSGHPLYLRIVSAKVNPEKREEARAIYNEHIIPRLQKVKGCRYAFLSENQQNERELFSITLWDSKELADAYEQSGLYQELVDKLKHTFTDLYQWKMQLQHSSSKRTVSSDDVTVDKFTVVTGKSFK